MPPRSVRTRLPKSLEDVFALGKTVLGNLNALRDAARRASDDLATARPVVTFAPEGVAFDFVGGPAGSPGTVSGEREPIITPPPKPKRKPSPKASKGKKRTTKKRGSK